MINNGSQIRHPPSCPVITESNREITLTFAEKYQPNHL